MTGPSLPILDHVPQWQHAQESLESGLPGTSAWHAFTTEYGVGLLLVDGSRIFLISNVDFTGTESADELWDFVSGCDLDGIAHTPAPFADVEPAAGHPIRSLSLAVSQKCNLGCTYCYADGGSFGGPQQNMPLEVGLRSVDRLLQDAACGERVHLSFLGGEPLLNRPVLRAVTEAAASRAARQKVRLGLAVTTNGTLLTPDDGTFFEEHGFAVTVSLDGVGELHDAQRPFRGGRGSYDTIIERVRPLLAQQRRMQVSARVTVTPRNLHLRRTLDELIALGFHSVGFSPMLSSPAGRDEMQPDDLDAMLEQMMDCGREMERQLAAGHRYPFSNLATALEQLHRGTHRPYPCGAGAGYFGVSADGGLFACHRFVNEPAGAMGSLADGVDPARQAQWLSERHVHRQEPCRSCWARYLCGGGCHHEVIHRGRPACEFIRGWLHYCLEAYVRTLKQRPGYFGQTV